jgi:hypothetical protein
MRAKPGVWAVGCAVPVSSARVGARNVMLCYVMVACGPLGTHTQLRWHMTHDDDTTPRYRARLYASPVRVLVSAREQVADGGPPRRESKGLLRHTLSMSERFPRPRSGERPNRSSRLATSVVCAQTRLSATPWALARRLAGRSNSNGRRRPHTSAAP